MSLLLEACLVYDTWLVSDNAKIRNELLREEADVSLVARAQTSDLAAFEELVRRYRNDVFRLSYHYLHNREEAWDLSQEVFIKVYRSIGHFRGESNFKTWVLRIAANQCKDYFKKRRLSTVSFDDRIGVEPPGKQLEPGRALAAQEIGEAIQTALAKLPHKHRTAFVLREFEGLSYEEMSQVMECSLGTVMSRLHHARKKLQQSLIHMGIAEESES
jgi:RNA polymerase sigma-70 factor (ECF subfamily)